MPPVPTRRLASCALFALLVVSVANAAAPEDRSELKGLPADVQQALADGKVVLLEGRVDDTSVSTKIVAVIPAAPAAVVDQIRDYDQMGRVVPGLRAVSYDRGDNRDTYRVEVKPHPMLPLMELAKQVTIEPEADGDVTVDIELLSSSYARIQDQHSEWQLLKLDDSSTLAIYQTRDRYSALPFANRVLDRVADTCQRLVNDVRARCVQHAEARLTPPAAAPRSGF